MVSLAGSPTTAATFWDDIPRLGFGSKHEFEFYLEEAWTKHERRHRGRLARYGQFGMTELEARRPTPEPIREAYEKLIKEIIIGEGTPESAFDPEELEDWHRRRLARYSRVGMTEKEAQQPTPEHYREAYMKLLEEGLDVSTPKSKMWLEDIQDQRRGRLERYSQFGMTEEEARRPTPEHYREAYALNHTPLASPVRKFNTALPRGHNRQSGSTLFTAESPIIPTIEMDGSPSSEYYTNERKLDPNLASNEKIPTLISPPSSMERRLSKSIVKQNKGKSNCKVKLASPVNKIQKRQNKQPGASQRLKAGRTTSSIHAMATQSRAAARRTSP